MVGGSEGESGSEGGWVRCVCKEGCGIFVPACVD